VLTVLDRDLSVEWPIGTLITDWVLKKLLSGLVSGCFAGTGCAIFFLFLVVFAGIYNTRLGFRVC